MLSEVTKNDFGVIDIMYSAVTLFLKHMVGHQLLYLLLLLQLYLISIFIFLLQWVDKTLYILMNAIYSLKVISLQEVRKVGLQNHLIAQWKYVLSIKLNLYILDFLIARRKSGDMTLVVVGSTEKWWRVQQPFLRTPADGIPPPSNRYSDPLVDCGLLHSTSRCPTSTGFVHKSVSCSCVFMFVQLNKCVVLFYKEGIVVMGV